MRTFTNNANLPDAMYRALTANYYDSGDADITTTGIIKPPFMVQLKKRFEDQIVTDASELVFSLFGQAVHVVLERAAGIRSIGEERLKAVIRGWKVSGQSDLYEEANGIHTLSDWKITSLYAFLLGEKKEWEAQVNINAEFFRRAGFQVDKVQIVAILRDWVAAKARTQKDYPPTAVHVAGQPLWTPNQASEYIDERVGLHQSFSGKPIEDIPVCSPEERWYRGESYAVYKNGNKKATAVRPTLEAAKSFIDAEKDKLTKGRFFIDPIKREGVNQRCLYYCDVRTVCPFRKTLVDNLVNESDEGEE